MKKYLSFLALGTTIALVFTGCTAGVATRTGAQTHFDYPNSNITPLGPVQAKFSTPVTVFGDIRTSATDELYYNTAIEKVNGANMLLDYVVSTKYKWVWCILTFNWTKVEIEGTAARMEVGQQKLK